MESINPPTTRPILTTALMLAGAITSIASNTANRVGYTTSFPATSRKRAEAYGEQVCEDGTVEIKQGFDKVTLECILKKGLKVDDLK